MELLIGVIFLFKFFDREIKDFYRLEVEVIDGGGLKFKNLVVVEVIVLDVNDEFLVFEFSFYNFIVIENFDLQIVLGSVYVLSKDLGINVDIYYSINGGNIRSVFSINFIGIIFIQSNIDYEIILKVWFNI